MTEIEKADRDAVLAAVLHEFGPDGCAKVLARLPEARDYVNALRKPTRPREQEGAPQVAAGRPAPGFMENVTGARRPNATEYESLAKYYDGQAESWEALHIKEPYQGWDEAARNSRRMAAGHRACVTQNPLPTLPRAEPVAWLQEHDGLQERYLSWKRGGLSPAEDPEGFGWVQTPLFAHPLPAASFQAGAEAMREAAAKVVQDHTARYVEIDDPADEAARSALWEAVFAIRELPIPASSEGR